MRLLFGAAPPEIHQQRSCSRAESRGCLRHRRECDNGGLRAPREHSHETAAAPESIKRAPPPHPGSEGVSTRWNEQGEMPRGLGQRGYPTPLRQWWDRWTSLLGGEVE
jgi:hypothetical protein